MFYKKDIDEFDLSKELFADQDVNFMSMNDINDVYDDEYSVENQDIMKRFANKFSYYMKVPSLSPSTKSKNIKFKFMGSKKN